MTLLGSLQQELAAEPSATLQHIHQSQNRQVQIGRLRNIYRLYQNWEEQVAIAQTEQ